MLRIAIFVLATAGIVCRSWPSLRDRASHGFYRFFAFEAILILILLNTPGWFRDPLALHQVISWLLLVASIPLAIHGFHVLRVIGQPEGDFEKTTSLVTLGAYRYIRHPLYSSLLLLAWGVFFKKPSPIGALLAVAASAALWATARVEERENVEKFGGEYVTYMQSSKMFVPFLF